MKNEDFLNKCCNDVNINLTKDMQSNLMKYMKFLLDYNEHTNLTSITDEKEIILKHFVDSISPILNKNLNLSGNIIDIGTGAGFPGIPLAIVLPNTKFVLLDSLTKRTNFLNELIQFLNLKNVEIVNGRSETIAHDKKYRDSFDFAVSRAVAPLNKLLEISMCFVKPYGKFISYKSKNVKIEIDEAKNTFLALNSELFEIFYYNLSNADNIDRNLVIVNKFSTSPSEYPRKPNKIKNSPIF
ncbi:MAG: 16S rRNA (guanine(527)-N(7))-methyltransferase RsmG [Defluviitaleaceae bacterium]|nr:16S rRNA (guanine(527)-N(7))-methyltransferase RsmG [Defluviitaleaceae bacterium]